MNRVLVAAAVAMTGLRLSAAMPIVVPKERVVSAPGGRTLDIVSRL